MRKILLFIILATLVVISCKTKRDNFVSKYLSPANLPQQMFTINTQKDTAIKTQQGIVVKIAAGSIEAASPTVTLQIKEALSLEDILQAGLTTQTSKGILSSEGMFNITTVESSIIKKPLQIELPTDAVDENMQLYKGFEADGKIVWQEPKKIEAKPADTLDGKALFMKNCASCHAVDRKLTGPALAGVENRWQQRANLIAYIKNNNEFMRGQYKNQFASNEDIKPESDMITGVLSTEGQVLEDSGNRTSDTTFPSTEKAIYTNAKVASTKKAIKSITNKDVFDKDILYARRLYCDYNKSAMNVFEEVLNDKEVNAILKYLKRESKLLPTHTVSNTSITNLDSCEYYIRYYQALLNKRDSIYSSDNSMIVKELKQANTPISGGTNNNASSANPFGGANSTVTNNSSTDRPISKKVNPDYYESDKYQFTIETYGWYNIDRLLDASLNSKISELTVQMQSTETKRIQLFLVIPALNIFTEGGILKDGKTYGFYDDDGSLYLPQGVDAFVYAVGEEGGKLFYGSQQFITSLKQHIELKFEATNKDEIIKKVQAFKLKDFSMNIVETNKLENTKSIDKEIERVEIKVSECDCWNQQTTTVPVYASK